MSAGPIERLPNELLRACLDLGDAADILRSSHICTRWRVTARACPAFWRRIQIGALSNTALDFFQARINSSCSPGITVAIDIGLSKTQLPAESVFQFGVGSALIRMELEKHLYRVSSLSILAPDRIMSVIRPALAAHAGVLTHLTLGIVSGVGAQYRWPREWISTYTPVLRSLHLENIALSITEPEMWFALAIEVKLSFTRSSIYVLPADLFHRFPRCEKVQVITRGEAKIHVVAPAVETGPRQLAYNYVAMIGSTVVQQLLPTIPREPVTRSIAVASSSSLDLAQLLSELSEPLELTLDIRGDPIGLHASFKQLSEGKRPQLGRHAIIWPAPGLEGDESAIALLAHLTADIMNRVSRLKLQLSSVHLLGRIATTPRVETLMVEVAHDHVADDWIASRLTPGRVRDTLPHLKRVEFYANRHDTPIPPDQSFGQVIRRFFGRVQGQTDGWTYPETFVAGFASTAASQIPSHQDAM